MSQLIDQWEAVTDAMAERLVESWKAMSDQIGERPLWNEKLPERTQARQYQLVRTDPQAWASLMHEHGYVETTKYMLRGERLSAKYPDEVAIGQDAKMGEQLLAAASMPQPAEAAQPPGTPTTPTMAEERHTLRQPQALNLSEGQIGAQ